MAHHHNSNNSREGNRINDYWREASGHDPKERAERMQRDMDTFSGRGLEGFGRRRPFGRRRYFTTRSAIPAYIIIGVVFIGLIIYAIMFYSREETTETHTISFESNGGTTFDDLTFEKDKPFPMLLKTPTKDGYQFMGWFIDEALTRPLGPSVLNFLLQLDLKLYAKWVPSDMTKDITFETSGGSEVLPQTFTVGDSLRLYTPTKTGYHFLGWHKDSTFNQHITHIDDASETLYALWGRYEMSSIGQTGDIYYVPKQGGYDEGVAIQGGFQIGRYEVTYDLWHEVLFWASTHGYTFGNPGRPGNVGSVGAYPTGYENQPVTSISWMDAVVWLNAFSEYEGLDPVYYYYSDVLRSVNAQVNNITVTNKNGYRLPTMMEWMMAARLTELTESRDYAELFAGHYWVDENYLVGQIENSTLAQNDVAWHINNSGSVTHDVGLKAGNAWGLYDMSGNVSEWIQDFYAENGMSKSVMGGHYDQMVNPSVPLPFDITTSVSSIGFRIARGPVSPYQYFYDQE